MADASHPHGPKTNLESAVPQQETAKDPHNEPSLRVGADVRVVNTNEENRRTAEAEEQRRQWWKNLREWAPIVISITAAGFSFGSCYGSNRSAETAREAFHVMQSNERPWVAVDVQTYAPFAFSNGGDLGMNIGIGLKNVGKSVALDVRIWADIAFADVDGRYLAAVNQQTERCNDLRQPQDSPDYLPTIAQFPGGNFSYYIRRVGKWAKEITTEVARALPQNKGKVGFVIIGCVSYRTASEELSHWRHQTRFLYAFGRQDGGNFDPFITPRGRPEDIILVSWGYGNNAD